MDRSRSRDTIAQLFLLHPFNPCHVRAVAERDNGQPETRKKMIITRAPSQSRTESSLNGADYELMRIVAFGDFVTLLDEAEDEAEAGVEVEASGAFTRDLHGPIFRPVTRIRQGRAKRSSLAHRPIGGTSGGLGSVRLLEDSDEPCKVIR